MVNLVIDPGQENHPLLHNLPEGCRVIPVTGATLSEAWQDTPSVLVLLEHSAILHCRGWHEEALERRCRIMVVLEPAMADAAVKARLAGADSVLIAPPDGKAFRHAIANEYAAAGRWRQADALTAAKTRLVQRYELRKVLGVGLRSIFFLAFDQQEQREVTIKMLRKMLSGQTALLNEFQTEATRLREVHSEAVVPLLAVESQDGELFLVFDFGEARNLYQLAAQENPAETEVLRMAFTICRGLEAMRQHGLLHCDIKPENILFRNGNFYVSEFGLVTPLAAPYDNSGFPYWGDAGFSSPEFFLSGVMLNGRSDVCSLGILLYTMLNLENPFYGYDYETSYARHNSTQELNFNHPTTPPGSALRTVLTAMLANRPESRPRLRELKIIFQYALALRTGKLPTDTMPLPAAEAPKIPVPAANASGRNKSMSDDDTRTISARSGRIKVGRTQSLPVLSAKDRYRRRTVAGLVVAAAFLAGFLVHRAPSAPGYFQQGPLQMFTCYNGHTHALRTLDFRTVRCPECHELTSLSCTCAKCGKVFGLSLWPKRDMTEEECAKFEEKLHHCPYCGSTAIRPTKVVRDADAPAK